MDQLIYQGNHTSFAPLVEELTPGLARHLGDIQAATALVKAGMDESCKTHCRALEIIATTVETAHQMIQAAAAEGRITPLKAMALDHLTRAYMYEILSIADNTDAKILTILARW